MFEDIEGYVLLAVACFLLGMLSARFYYRKELERRGIGDAFEFAMLGDQVSKLSSLTDLLGSTIKQMKECSEDIEERLVLIRDLEETVRERTSRSQSYRVAKPEETS